MPYSFSVPKTFKIGEWETEMAKWIPTPLAVMKSEGSRAPRQLGVSLCPAVTIAGWPSQGTAVLLPGPHCPLI